MLEWNGSRMQCPWEDASRLYGCGRAALQDLIRHGQATRGWRRVWIPSYYCPDVAETLAATGLDARIYKDIPGGFAESGSVEFKAGDVLVVSNTFGIRSRSLLMAPESVAVDVIEDHTHDPWSVWAQGSKADFCVASIRKVLPIPDGAVLWSPLQHVLPEPRSVTSVHRTAALEKLAAMALKALYLEGQPIPKALFRDLSASGERALGNGPPSRMSDFAKALLPVFPIRQWRQQRRENHSWVSDLLRECHRLTVLQPDHLTDLCPFSVILLFDSLKMRDYVRERLIAANVYPAILWSFTRHSLQAGVEERRFSNCMLSIHCDMRYSRDDMARVATLIKQSVKESGL
jgi:hypothetical protein